MARIDSSQQVGTLHADLCGEFLDSHSSDDLAERMLQGNALFDCGQEKFPGKFRISVNPPPIPRSSL